ncbi:MAG: hypothetical protein SF123_06910 [Chloroflexota bacterium]|nr:hypothetical protein [Chloroflexota bacterium]
MELCESNTDESSPVLRQSDTCRRWTGWNATDTAWFPTPTYWRLLETRLQLIVLDETYGDVLDRPAQVGHNTLAMIRLIAESLRREQVLSKQSQLVLTHLALNHHSLHAELAAVLQADGLVPGYDGMVIEIQ